MPTNVFISWSGEKSHQVAETLHKWLPVVLQSVKPFISSEDLRKGGRWVSELSKELEKDNFGIVCLTPSNLLAPWILFETGALSKSVGDSQVVPFLVGVKPSDLPAPLTQFNAASATKSEFVKLVHSINERAGPEAVARELLERSADACWSNIEKELERAIEPPAPVQSDKAKDAPVADKVDAILQELLVLNRAQSKILTSPEDLLPRGYVRNVLRDVDSRMPPPDHAVWRDLFATAWELRNLASHGELERGSDVALRLEEICGYLRNRIDPDGRYIDPETFSRRRRPSRRPDATPTDAADTPADDDSSR